MYSIFIVINYKYTIHIHINKPIRYRLYLYTYTYSYSCSYSYSYSCISPAENNASPSVYICYIFPTLNISRSVILGLETSAG